MKKKIDELTARPGQFIRVNNMERFEARKNNSSDLTRRAEHEYYISVQVFLTNSKEARCLLFTEREYERMDCVDHDETMDSIPLGKLHPTTINHKACYLLKSKHWDGGAQIIRVSKTLLKIADARARKHPKSITTKPALTDMFD